MAAIGVGSLVGLQRGKVWGRALYAEGPYEVVRISRKLRGRQQSGEICELEVVAWQGQEWWVGDRPLALRVHREELVQWDAEQAERTAKWRLEELVLGKCKRLVRLGHQGFVGVTAEQLRLGLQLLTVFVDGVEKAEDADG